MGKRKQPYYRIVVTDSRRSRDGKYIESVGHYNPRDKKLIINKERVEYWLSKGAQPSNTAGRLWKRYLTSVSSEISKTENTETETRLRRVERITSEGGEHGELERTG